jgi:hypothetical protein
VNCASNLLLHTLTYKKVVCSHAIARETLVIVRRTTSALICSGNVSNSWLSRISPCSRFMYLLTVCTPSVQVVSQHLAKTLLISGCSMCSRPSLATPPSSNRGITFRWVITNAMPSSSNCGLPALPIIWRTVLLSYSMYLHSAVQVAIKAGRQYRHKGRNVSDHQQETPFWLGYVLRYSDLLKEVEVESKPEESTKQPFTRGAQS